MRAAGRLGFAFERVLRALGGGRLVGRQAAGFVFACALRTWAGRQAGGQTDGLRPIGISEMRTYQKEGRAFLTNNAQKQKQKKNTERLAGWQVGI